VDADLLKAACAAVRPLLGVHLSLRAPEVIEQCGLLGFRWVFLDAEHQPISPENCYPLVAAAQLHGMPCIVRVPRLDTHMIEQFLDAGVLGIALPQVASAAMLQRLVNAVKFAPEGTRGASCRSRAANYGLIESPAEYYQRANRSIVTVALVESRDGIDALEELVTVPGIDYFAIGANDLGLSMGIRAGAADPQVSAAIATANHCINQARKPQLAVASTIEQAREAEKNGARLIAVSDAALLKNSATEFLEKFGMTSRCSRC
jgi:2-keto-3-deoxy-L-rhamnonate aldolase RhmA